MDDKMKEKLRRIAVLSKKEVGDSEESVKINFVVPFLECFGHDRLDFEYKYEDIVIKKDIPRSCKVIVETKNYDKNLDKELQQLENYCDKEHPLLGIIANGHEIRVFSPSWRFRDTFRNTLIYSINRKDLNDNNIVRPLENVLSRNNLESGKAKEYVIDRENEIEGAERKSEEIKEEFKKEEEELKVKIGGLNQQIEGIRIQIKNLTTQISDEKSKRDEQIRETWKKIGLPVPFPPPIKEEYIPTQPSLRGKKSWVEYIQMALEEMGGEAHLSEIYERVKELKKRNDETIIPHITAAVRNALETNSRGKGKDVFEPVEIGSGRWRLKK